MKRFPYKKTVRPQAILPDKTGRKRSETTGLKTTRDSSSDSFSQRLKRPVIIFKGKNVVLAHSCSQDI